jgi:hypothetical protein
MIRSEHGVSLVEALIAAGATAGIALAIGSLMNQQSKQLQATSQKLAALELEALMIQALADGSICTARAQAANWRFDSTALASATVTTSGFPLSLAAGAPMLVQANQGVGSGLTVENVRFERFESLGTDAYSVDLTVNFKTAGAIRPIKAIAIRSVVSTDPATPANNKRITACSVSSAANGPYCVWENARIYNANWGIRKCTGKRRLRAGGCSCGGTGCGGSNAMRFSHPLVFEPNSPSILECTGSAGCNTANRIVCSGTDCNAWDCRYQNDVAELYISVFCCDPPIP